MGIWGRSVAFAAIALTLNVARALATSNDYTPVYAEKPSAPGVTEYVFAVHPQHNPAHLFAVYGPIADYLTANMPGVRFRVEASRNYEEFEKNLYAGRYHFALPNSLQTTVSFDHGYRAFVKFGDDEKYCGVIIVRRDAGIEQISDLKGKTVSYPAPTAFASAIMPQFYFQNNGLNVRRDIRNSYVGSQESAILNVYHGLSAAGGAKLGPWLAFERENPDIAKELQIKWRTEATLPNNAVVVRNDVPKEHVEKVAQLLLKLGDTEAGRKLLDAISLSRFETATNETYYPMRDYLRRFTSEVRPVDER